MTTMRWCALFLSLLSSAAFVGCATTRGSQLNAQELQGRVLHLESLAEQRDQELAQLRDELAAEHDARQALERRLGGTAAAGSTASAGAMTVREVQQALQRAGFDPGPIDGKMGRRTREALRNFQQAQGLVADGRIGPQTIGRLKAYMTPSTAGEK